MKKTNRILLVAVLLIGTLFQSCETIELEQLDDPNNITQGTPQFLLNRIQDRYRVTQVIFNDRSSELTRIDYMFGRNYFNNYTATALDTPWRDLYSTMIPDIEAIENAQNDTNDLRLHLGMSKIMQAHLMMQLVDFIGDLVPLEFANRPLEFPTPELSTNAGSSAYAEALALLDEAIASLSGADVSTAGVQDLYYGDLESGGADSDPAKWVKLANTLKMRAAITTGDFATFNSIAANADNYISSSDDDFQFTFGTQQAPVNTQHQDYQNDYTPSGANIYQSNWLMDLMLNNDDPRRRYYFYRQNACTFGALPDVEGCEPNGEALSCSLQGAPPHLIGTPSADIFCYVQDGYWGRLHGNDEGTPPDSDLRTAIGVYPGAGRFDDDSFDAITLGQGGQGAGIEPIILASYVDFWKAEVALSQGSTSDAAGFMADGLTKSIAKVQDFIGVDGGADATFAPSGADIATFLANIDDAFNGGDDNDRWNILGEQYFTTLYGGGADAHNFYRRTGYPNTVSDNIEPNPGNYIRTFLIPQAEVTANSNITQRTNNDDAVFWNTQSLPTAN